MNLDRLLYPKEVAEHLGVTLKKVNQLAREGELPYIQLSPRKRRFLPEQLKEFVEKRVVLSTKPVDNKALKPLPSKQKGGKKKSVEGVGTDLGKEIRSLCR